MSTSRIVVIHENGAWVEPLRKALADRGLPFGEWQLSDGSLDLASEPPPGIFYSRMSASSHTRGHRYAPEYTSCVLSWLERHRRRVINPSRALQLELSKAAQYMALQLHDIRTPQTIIALGHDDIVEAGHRFSGPFVIKHNRAGKGLGVRRFDNGGQLESYVRGPGFERSVDGVTLLQQYITSPESKITRVEFVGGRLLYAVHVDTSDGFELCPAEACRIVPGTGVAVDPIFEVELDFEHPLVEAYQGLLAANGIEIAGVEFITDAAGTAYTYDINTTTNYSPEAEERAGVPGYGVGRVADFLGAQYEARDDLRDERLRGSAQMQ